MLLEVSDSGLWIMAVSECLVCLAVTPPPPRISGLLPPCRFLQRCCLRGEGLPAAVASPDNAVRQMRDYDL